ncbi:MAG: hypothetical protein IJX72_07170 [Clostridia bacterium]|nr:hypothetical protein [Clostridia bacterium]
MPKKNPFNRLRKMAQNLYNRAAEQVKRFGRQTDEVLSEEPIDFSAPSIPYYENLANRLSFVRVVLYMVLLVFVVVTVICNHRLITYENLYYLAKDVSAATITAQSQADQISYPISSSDSDFALYRGGMVIAGSEVVTAVSGSGRQTLSANVAYAEPCVRASDKYCLTFGRGEKSFTVYNSFVQVYREITDFPVYEAAVGDNGNFAIVTRSRDYTSDVIIYDGDMEKLANYHLNGYVTGLAMNQEGDRLGVVSVESVNGLWETKVTLIRIEKRISQSSATLTGSFGSTCGFVDEDRFAVVCSDRLMILGTDATVNGEALFEGTTPTLCAVGEGRVAILSKVDTDISENLLKVFDKNGRIVYHVSMDATHPIQVSGNATEMALGGDILYIRTADKLYRLSGNGKDLTAVSVSRDTLAVLPTEDEVLVCTPAYAARLHEDDFVKE